MGENDSLIYIFYVRNTKITAILIYMMEISPNTDRELIK